MKKNKFIVFYSIFASILFAASLIYLVFNLITEYKIGYDRTKRRFEHFTISVQKLSNDEYNSKKDYYSNLEKAIGDLNDFSFLQIKENDKTIYVYPSETSQPSFDSNLINNFTDYFYIDNNYYSIVADLYTLRPISIFYYSKITFICILIVTVITFILIIYYSVEEKRTGKIQIDEVFENIDDEKSEETSFDEDTDDNSEEIKEESSVKEETLPETTETEDNKTEEIINSDENKSDESKTEKVCITENQQEEIKSVIIEEKNESSENIVSDSDTSFYSTTTGLVKQENLIPRLNKEIEKAVSSEFDLSLILFKFPKIKISDENFSILSKFLIDKFQFKDLLFEYNNDGIAVIKMNDNLENALDFSDKILPELKDLLKENNEVYIGITARSLRMISGERLLLEANEALVHAQQTPEDPIIAFRANVEKYRQFMENK